MKKLCCVILMTVLMALLCAAAWAEISLPNGVTAIGAEAFAGDASLTGVVTLPGEITSIGSRAFAGTGLHGVVVPAGCESIAADAFSGSNVVYVLFAGAGTQVEGGSLADVRYLFAPADSSLAYDCDTAHLYCEDFLFYSIGEDAATPLCVGGDPSYVGECVTIPKFVEGRIVMTIEELDLTGLSAPLVVPTYLQDMADEMNIECETQSWMTVSAPVADLTEAAAGEAITWTTSVEGAYGPVTYLWTFDVDGVLSSEITTEPSVTWTSATAGSCVATVEAVDQLTDSATASGEAVTFTAPKPTYRALLIGNVYAASDEETQLKGPTTDVAAVRSVLTNMSGTPFSVTTKIDLTKPGMISAIASAFSGAKEGDVSLFYYSGHGSSDGSLVGTDFYGLSASALRQQLDAVLGTKIVILDSCYSGGMIGKSNSAGSPAAFNSAIISAFSSFNKDNLAANNYIVLTAASGSQQSQELSDGTVNFGGFTYGLCYGSGYDEWNQCYISGLPADTDGNQAISLGEAKTVAQEKIAWLMEMVGVETYNVQYYGDTSFVLWSK